MTEANSKKNSQVLQSLIVVVLARENGLLDPRQLGKSIEFISNHPDRPLLTFWLQESFMPKAVIERFRDLLTAKLKNSVSLIDVLDDWSGVSSAIQEISKHINSHSIRASDTELTKAWSGFSDEATKSRKTTTNSDSQGEGRFQIIRKHAHGGLGVVYLAKDNQLQREVAFKQIRPDRGGSQDLRNKFLFEAEVTGQLEHPTVVPVYALGTDPKGHPFYAMRFIRGQELKEVIQEFHQSVKSSSIRFDGPELRALLRRFLDVCNSIAYAHQRGVLHRDLKPGNVMLGKFGETFVVDWGLAKVISGSKGDDEESINNRSASLELSNTQMGQFIGTAAYAPPEQLQGNWDQLSEKSDVYSLGAILYEILTGFPPHHGFKTVSELLAKAKKDGLPRTRLINPSVPRALDAVAAKCLNYEQNNRYPSPLALKADIEAWLDDRSVSCLKDTVAEKLIRLGRRNKAVAVTVFFSSLVLMVSAIIGGFIYRDIANREKVASLDAANKRIVAERATEQAEIAADVATRANLRSQETLAEASVRELNEANRLIRESYFPSDETGRPSRLDHKGSWHFGVANLMNAIRLDPNNDMAKLRLYDSLVHQGRSRRSIPKQIIEFDKGSYPIQSPYGRYLLVRQQGKNHIVDLESATLESKPLPAGINPNALLKEDRVIACFGDTLQLIDSQTFKQILSLPLKGYQEVCLSQDRNSLFFYSATDKTVRRFDWQGKELAVSVEPLAVEFSSQVAFIPKTDLILVAKNASLSWINILTGDTNRVTLAMPFLDPRTTWFQGKLFASPVWGDLFWDGGHSDGLFVIPANAKSPDGFKRAATLSNFYPAVSTAAVCPDGNQIAIGWWDGSLELLNLVSRSESNEPTFKSRGKTSALQYPYRKIVFSEDALRLATFSDSHVRIWNALTLEPIGEPLAFLNKPRSIFLSQTGSNCGFIFDTHVQIFDASLGGMTSLCIPSEREATEAQFLKDNRLIIGWNKSSRNQMGIQLSEYETLNLNDAKRASNAMIEGTTHIDQGVVASPDGHHFATMTKTVFGRPAKVNIWRSSGEKIAETTSLFPIDNIQWTPNGERLVLASEVDVKSKFTGHQFWDWQLNQNVATTELFGKESFSSFDGGTLAVIGASNPQAERQLHLLNSLDMKELKAPITLPNFGRIIALQLLWRERVAIVWELVKEKPTNSGTNRTFRLWKVNCQTGLVSDPIEVTGKEPLVSRTIHMLTKYCEKLQGYFICIDRCNCVLNVNAWKMIQLENVPKDFFQIALTSNGEFVYKHFRNPFTLGQVWDVDSGLQKGVSEVLGNLVASPTGRWINVYNNRMPMGFYDSSLSNEFLEPIPARDKLLRFNFLSSFSLDESLIAVDTPMGVTIRELPSENLQSSIRTATYDELTWIWDWLAMTPRAAGGYDSVEPKLARQRLIVKMNSLDKDEGAWGKLLQWLLDPSDDRLLTPTSRWTSGQAHDLMLKGTVASAKELSFRFAPQMTGTRPIIAQELEQQEINNQQLWRKELISRLKGFQSR
jgi:WD40 repeat protein/tRNA A-37 threonylcarbamoyl transferase component Bud32